MILPYVDQFSLRIDFAILFRIYFSSFFCFMIFPKRGRGMTDFFYIKADFNLSNAQKHIRSTTNDVKLFETAKTREYLLLFLQQKIEI